MDGGSWGLLGVLRDHRGAVEYDFRTRFHLGLDAIGRDMSLAEAARHVQRFRADPSSALAAEVEGWTHPVSRLEAVVMDLWDLTAAASAGKKAPKYPREWAKNSDTKRRGNAAGRSAAQVLTSIRPQAPV